MEPHGRPQGLAGSSPRDEWTPEYSIVVPVFNEAESLDELVQRVMAVFADMRLAGYEIVFVDDGSTDSTPERLARLQADHGCVTIVRLRRNFGKSMALMAGFRAARGDIVITMDGDLQDRPEDIPRMIAGINDGLALVNGWRSSRSDGIVRKLGSRLYNGTVRYVTGLDLHDFNCGFKAYRGDLARTLCIYGQHHRYIPLHAHLLGFKVGEVPVTNNPRRHGYSKYRAIRYQGFFDFMSILFTYRFGMSPLHFFGLISLFLIIPSVLILGAMFVQHAMALIGFGEQYLMLERPLLSISLNMLVMGTLIFLTGFVCDFILHHQIRSNIADFVSLAVGSVSLAERRDAHKAVEKPTSAGISA
jgi:glycosyltransferase involved in cell wall biosynthesis